MSHEMASRHITIKDYPIPYAFTGSSRREETDMNEVLDRLFFLLMRQELLEESFSYRGLLPAFEIDLSSVRPYFEPMNRSSLIEEFCEEILPEETLEYDVIVQMPPRKRYTIELEVKSIKKAEPIIVEPEWI